MCEYDLIAGWYSTDRGGTVGVAEALAVAATLPAGPRILDVGCGHIERSLRNMVSRSSTCTTIPE
jgi:hypothetical protein